EYIYALQFEWHIIYFIQSFTEVIVILILSQHKDAGKHVNWL
ncbi:type II toxin-antitoxin system RelE/ParE family toxin, partial [Salmonella enterica]